MTPTTKKIMTRYSFIILVMVLIGIAIVITAGVIISKDRIGHTVHHAAVGFDLAYEEILVHMLISL